MNLLSAIRWVLVETLTTVFRRVPRWLRTVRTNPAAVSEEWLRAERFHRGGDDL